MARPKAFNRQTALDKAMYLFWTRGFEATTMTDLRKAMGIGRQSLYDTFGDKNQLFAEALQQYVRLNDADVAEHLSQESGIDGIRLLFDSRVQMLSTGVRRGCLMMNSTVELSLHDPEVASKLHNGLATMRKGFEAALHGAVQKGEISPKQDIADLAAFLVAQIAGMVVMSKNNASRPQLQTIADCALKAIA